MKTILVVFSLCLIGTMGQMNSGPLSMLTSEQRAKIRSHKEECVQESGVELSAIDNFKNGMLDENDEKLACFGACMLKKIGILTADGSVNESTAMAKIPSVAPGMVDEILQKCGNIRGDNFCMTGGKIMKCFKEHNFFNILG